MFSCSEPDSSPSCFTLIMSHMRKNLRSLKQKSPEDFVLDINKLNLDFATSSYNEIDNLCLRVFFPWDGFKIYTVKDGDQVIFQHRFSQIERAILVYYGSDPYVLYIDDPYNTYYLKTDGKWREIDYFECAERLNEARTIIPIKEITIDTSSIIPKKGLLMGGYKYGSTYQYEYATDCGYEARILSYGDDVIWKAENDTQRCMEATIFLNNYEPIGMTALIYADDFEIVYYKFQNNKWRNIDEEDYMKMVRSYKPFRGDFEIQNHEHDYDLITSVWPIVDLSRKPKQKSPKTADDAAKLPAEDQLTGQTTADSAITELTPLPGPTYTRHQTA